MNDIAIQSGCGCKVTYFESSGFRSSTLAACGSHIGPDQIKARKRVMQSADREKWKLLHLRPWMSPTFGMFR